MKLDIEKLIRRTRRDLLNDHPIPDEDIVALIAEVERYQWRPIETAPKDGSEFLLVQPDGSMHVSYHYQGSWGFSPEPTHWMPLPPAPVSEGDA